MDFNHVFDPDDFSDDLEQIREYEPSGRYPLPRVTRIFQDRSGSGVTVEWNGRMYDLISYGTEPYDEVAVVTHEPGAGLRQTVIAGDEVNASLLPFDQADVVQVIAWRVYHSLFVAAHALLDDHAEQVVTGLNQFIQAGLAPVAQLSTAGGRSE